MQEKIAEKPQWTPTQKQLLRFFGLYFFIYFFFPFIDNLFHGALWDPIVLKAGQLLGVWREITVTPNGSGDTTYNYVQLLCILTFAFLGSITWWIADHKRSSYNTLLYWLMALLRYMLAYILLQYGFSKVFYSQFQFPAWQTLIKPYGDATPMNLAWTFMGYSHAYNIFTGLLEAIGGALLLFRRTTMFGCLFSMTVVCNIVALNFCYDIPVKLFSSHLLLAIIFICVPYMPRLWAFFLLHREIPAMPKLSLYNTRKKRIAHNIIKGLIIMWLAWLQLGVGEMRDYYYKKPVLYGLCTVDNYTHNGEIINPLASDSTVWHYLAIELGGGGCIQMVNGKNIYYGIETDTIRKTMTLKNRRSDETTVLNYRREKGQLYITAMKPADTISVKLHLKNPNDFRLIKTGFHWINEYPNNR